MNKIEKCRNSQLHRIVVHKGDVEKRIYEYELNNYLADGWEKGQSASHKKANAAKHLGKSPWNKNTKGVMKPNSGTFKKGQVAWNKGKTGCYVSSRKGQTKETNASIAAVSLKLKDAWVGNEARRKAAGEKCRERAGRKLSQEQLHQYLDKCYQTYSKNNSFNISKPEDDYYKMLCEQFGACNVKRNYKDKQRYPFRCDFYVVPEDLFIELNLHWTHGSKPFDSSDKFCQSQLLTWQEKAKTSQFYKNAIETWTRRDVFKKSIAEKNHLNYKVIY